MHHPYYLADTTGKLRFTKRGLAELQAYFAKAGIDIHKIDTVEEYYSARQQSSPYFMEWQVRRETQVKQMNTLPPLFYRHQHQ